MGVGSLGDVQAGGRAPVLAEGGWAVLGYLSLSGGDGRVTALLFFKRTFFKSSPQGTLMETWKFQRDGFIYSVPQQRILRQTEARWPLDMGTRGQRRLPSVLTMVRADLQENVATLSSKLTGVFDLLLASS